MFQRHEQHCSSLDSLSLSYASNTTALIPRHKRSSQYWSTHIEHYDDLIYSRDLWNMTDMFTFAICSAPMPPNYHDLNFEDAESLVQRERRKTEKKEEKSRRKSERAIRKLEGEKAEEKRASSMGAGRKGSMGERRKKRGGENYQYQHYAAGVTVLPGTVGGGAFSPVAQKRGLGPGGLNPMLVLSEMPDSMRIAFEKNDMDMLHAVETGHDKKVNKEKFWIWMHQGKFGLGLGAEASREEGLVACF